LIFGGIATGVSDEFDVAKSIVLGVLSENVVGIDGFNAAVE
jgi:hypothetical protein